MTSNSTLTAEYARVWIQTAPPQEQHPPSLTASLSQTCAKGRKQHLSSSPATPHTMRSASQLPRKAENPPSFTRCRLRSARGARCLTRRPSCAKLRVATVSAGDSQTLTTAVLTSSAQALIIPPPPRNCARRITLSTKTGSYACQSPWCRDAKRRGP